MIFHLCACSKTPLELLTATLRDANHIVMWHQEAHKIPVMGELYYRSEVISRNNTVPWVVISTNTSKMVLFPPLYIVCFDCVLLIQVLNNHLTNDNLPK